MKKFLPPVISRYIAKLYLMNFIVLSGILFGIIYLFDVVELLRRASGHDDVSLLTVLQMGLFKLPEVGQQALPFTVLFAGIYTLWQMTKRSELIAVRASGLSIWQILSPVLGAVCLIGFLQITLVNPLGALLISKFEQLENRYLDRQTSLVSFSNQGLWLKQDHEDGHVILNASAIDMQSWVLKNIVVLFFDDAYRFVRRIDSRTAELQDGQWSFGSAVSNRPQSQPEVSNFLTMETNLTKEDIEDSFASAETISFWEMPSFIQTMRNTGFDPVRLEVYYQTLLSLPLLYMAMILLAACVSLRPSRSGGTFILIAGGVIIGFIIFFVSGFLQALGSSHQIPIILAAWACPAIAFFAGLSFLLNVEDG